MNNFFLKMKENHLVFCSPGADNAKDDGVYSAYFYQFDRNGAYSSRAYAKGTGGQTYILRENRELQYDAESNSFQGKICHLKFFM